MTYYQMFQTIVRAVVPTSVCILALIFAITVCGNVTEGKSLPRGTAISFGLTAPWRQVGKEATALEPGKAMEQQVSSAGKRSYQITLTGGQYALIEIECRNVSAVVRAFDEAGKLADVQRVSGSTDRIKLDIVAENPGNYRVEVESKAANAGPAGYTLRLLTVRKASETESRLYQAQRLNFDSSRSFYAGKYDDAQASAQKAMALSEATPGGDVELAKADLNLGNAVYVKGDYKKAKSFYLRALDILEKDSSRSPTTLFALFGVLNDLGGVSTDMGDLEEAEHYLERAFQVLDSVPGAGDRERAAVLRNLANVCYYSGDYPKAEHLYQQGLAVEQKAFGANSSNAAVALIQLGNLYIEIGEYEKGQRLDQRALAILEKSPAPEKSVAADADLSLAASHFRLGELEQAENFGGRALDLYEKAFGPEHWRVALALNDLGEIDRELGNFPKAEAELTRSLAIRKKLGDSGLNISQTLDSLGSVYRNEGDFGRAESLYKRALTLREGALGPDNPKLRPVLRNLATACAAGADFAEALVYQSRAETISEQNVELNLANGSEQQKLSYLGTLSEELDQTISLQVAYARDPAATELALTAVLRRKGRVMDAMADTLGALRRRSLPADRALLDRLNHLTSRLAAFVLNGPELSPAVYQAQTTALTRQRENLEAEISRRSPEFRAQHRPVTLDRIRRSIPDHAALIEYAVYRPFNPKSSNDRAAYGESHYVAYILRNTGEVGWKELGPAREIDARVATFRRALRDPADTRVRQIGRDLEQKIMQPVLAAAGDSTQLLISPDGQLNLIPFEALVDQRGRYLIERYSISYLTSGRDLLRLQEEPGSKKPPVVIADPLFGEPAGTIAASVSAKPSLTDRRRSVVVARDLSGTYFAPLPGTAEEAQAIHALFPDAVVLTGRKASKSALERIAAPEILHIATHGFFLQPAESNASRSGQLAFRGLSASDRAENPLLRSGLALAGANVDHSEDRNGILTALEASDLDLWGTQLVTLSACDTGVGEVKDGEGVYGLRRAFVLAGAQTLVMSLWSVSDYATRELMVGYYKNLKRGLGRGEALRQTKLEMLKRKDRRHPYYWASFIQSGAWGKL